MVQVPANYRRYFRDVLLVNEGGYAPERRENGRVIDPETFMGLTLDKWVTLLPRLSQDEVNTLPDGMRTRINRIRTASGDERTSLTREFLQYGGRLTDPWGAATTQKNAQTLNHTSLLPASDNSAQDNAALGAFKELVYGYYYRYAVNNGFDRYPDAIREDVIDFGVHGGSPRARWAAVKAMVEAGIISEDEFKSYPYITSAQANNKNCFSTQPGSQYCSSEINDRIVADLRNATPEQLEQMEARYLVWQRTYYKELVREDPSFRPYYNGWMARTSGEARPPQPEEPTTARARAPRAENPNGGSYSHPLIGETLGLDVQFRRAGGNLGGGIFGLQDAIAIDIPGHGVFTYAVTRDHEYVANTGLPPGVTLLPRLDSGRNLAPGEIANPYPRERTLTWLDEHGHRQFLPLSASLASNIQEADIAMVLGVRTGIGTAGEFSRDATGLKTSDSDQLQIVQTATGQRFQVLDMDQKVGETTYAMYPARTPPVSDFHPPTGRPRT